MDEIEVHATDERGDDVILNPGGIAYIAPVGTNPDDPNAWYEVGHITEFGLNPDFAPQGWQPGLPTGTITISRRARLTWVGHLVLLGRTHPAARRTKTAYHHRRR